MHLAVRRTFSRDIPSELLNHRLDLGVVSFVPQEPQLAAVKIFRDELAFVVSPRHRLAKRGRVDIADLGEEVFIAHIVESPFRNRVIQLFAKHHVPLRNAHRAAHHRKHQALRADGYGRGHRAAHVRALGDRARPARRSQRSAQLRMPRDLYLLYRRRGPLSHAATAMLQLLRPGGAPATEAAAHKGRTKKDEQLAIAQPAASEYRDAIRPGPSGPGPKD